MPRDSGRRASDAPGKAKIGPLPDQGAPPAGCLSISYRAIAELKPYGRNSRTHSQGQIDQIAASIAEFGWTNPILIDPSGEIIAGHGRLMAAQAIGLEQVPCIELAGLSEAQRRALVIADNKLAMNAGWNEDLLSIELAELSAGGFDIALIGFADHELADLGIGEGPGAAAGESGGAGSLSERFMIAPFSVLNAREGWWQNRKRAWLSLGIESECGRGENLLKMSNTILEPDPTKRAEMIAAKDRKSRAGAHRAGGGRAVNMDFKGASTNLGTVSVAHARHGGAKAHTTQDWVREKQASGELGPGLSGNDPGAGTSIFDPVLCELAYRWFSPPDGLILDPFAGGSVRGIVAAKLGRQYVGLELRGEQVAANRAQAAQICAEGIAPAWIEGDSRNLDRSCAEIEADFVFSCPPYADLERYSDDPADLSTLAYPEFREAYREIIAKACARLKPDRFACFVVGDVRDKRGNYFDFVGDTVQAFRDAGLEYYNEQILITACGSLAIRAGKQFSASRKFGKTHQNILYFLKGDAKRAVAALGKVDVAECLKAAEAELEAAAEEA